MNEVIKLLVLVSAMLKASHKNIITDIPVPEHWQNKVRNPHATKSDPSVIWKLVFHVQPSISH
jgi:hypothetical protein